MLRWLNTKVKYDGSRVIRSQGSRRRVSTQKKAHNIQYPLTIISLKHTSKSDEISRWTFALLAFRWKHYMPFVSPTYAMVIAYRVVFDFIALKYFTKGRNDDSPLNGMMSLFLLIPHFSVQPHHWIPEQAQSIKFYSQQLMHFLIQPCISLSSYIKIT